MTPNCYLFNLPEKVPGDGGVGTGPLGNRQRYWGLLGLGAGQAERLVAYFLGQNHLCSPFLGPPAEERQSQAWHTVQTSHLPGFCDSHSLPSTAQDS